MTKALYIFCFALFFGGLLYHFIPLKVFNFVIPKDAGSQLRSQSILYGSDPQQSLDVYEPTQRSAVLPILIFVHGGSWKAGNHSNYEFVGRAFASKDYLTLVISYRGLPNHTYPDFISDVALATKWASVHGNEYGGDSSKIFIVGHSAGAYDAAMAVLDKRIFEAAGVDPGVIKGVAGLAGPYDFLPLDSSATIETFGHVADLPSTQPINFSRADAPPFLFLHGTADTTVYPKNSRSLQKHLTDKGAKATLIEYKDVSHVGIILDIAKPLRGNAPVLDDIDKFFKDILR